MDFDTPELLRALEDFSEQILCQDSQVTTLEEVLAAEEHDAVHAGVPAEMETGGDTPQSPTRLGPADLDETSYLSPAESEFSFHSPTSSPSHETRMTLPKIESYYSAAGSYRAGGMGGSKGGVLSKDSYDYDMYQPWSSPESITSDDLFPELNF